jgi:Rod binding domain-containing protein
VQRHRISEIPIVSPKAVPNADSAHSKLSAILKQQIVKAEKHISSNPLISDRQYKWAGGEKSVNVPQKGPTTGENSYLDTSTTPVETPIKNRSPEHPPTGLRARNSPEKQSTPASVDRKRPESEARKKLEALRNQILNNYPKKQASDGVTIALSQVQPQTTQSTVHGSVYQSVINSPENKNLPNPSESPISSSRLAEISLNNKRSEKTLVNPILGRFAKEPRQPINSQGSSQRQLEPKPEKPNKQSADFRAPLRIPTDQSQSGVEAAKQGTATPAKRKPLYPSEKSTPVGLAPGSCSSLTNAEKSSTPHLFGEKPKNYASTLLQNYNVVGQSLLLLDKANPTNPRNTGSQERFTESMKFSKNELTSSLTNKSLGVIEGLNSQLNRKFSNTVINKKGSQPAQKSTSSRRSPLEPESPRVMSQRQVKAIAAQRPALDKVNLYSKGRPAESESYSPQHTPPTFYDKLSFEGKKILSSTRPMHQRNGSDSESVNSTASNKGSSMNIYQHNPRKLLS